MLLELDMLDKLPNLDVITENWCRGRARDVSHHFLAALNRCGAITAIDPCGNHLSVQNLADEPAWKGSYFAGTISAYCSSTFRPTIY